MVQSGFRAEGADRAPSTARSTATSWLRASDPGPRISRSALTCGRRCANTTLSAIVKVSPSASRSAISLASVPVRSLPSCLAVPASIEVSEKANVAPGQVDEEPSVEEAVGSFTGGL